VLGNPIFQFFPGPIEVGRGELEIVDQAVAFGGVVRHANTVEREQGFGNAIFMSEGMAMGKVSYVVVGVVAFVLAANIVNRFGQGWGLVFALMVLGSERARVLIGLFRRHLERHMALKEAAITMGVQQSQLSRSFALEENLSFTKAAALPDTVWRDFCQDYLEGHGYCVVPSGRVAQMTQAVRALSAAIEAHSTVTRSRQEVAG
jgi:hypothetical protein